MKIYVFHGVNLNLLGVREPEIYGKTSLEDLNNRMIAMGTDNGLEVECRQTNHEGLIVDWIAELKPADFLIINPGAWTHSSYALSDAIKGVNVPAVEVHISNIYAREGFRSHSRIAGACLGQISGLGTDSYLLALAYALEFQKYRQGQAQSEKQSEEQSKKKSEKKSEEQSEEQSDA